LFIIVIQRSDIIIKIISSRDYPLQTCFRWHTRNIYFIYFTLLYFLLKLNNSNQAVRLSVFTRPSLPFSHMTQFVHSSLFSQPIIQLSFACFMIYGIHKDSMQMLDWTMVLSTSVIATPGSVVNPNGLIKIRHSSMSKWR